LPARRGPFKDSGQRELTARTRKIGSCIRCRMQRIRVSTSLGSEYGARSIASENSVTDSRHSVTLIRKMRGGLAYRARRSPPIAGCIV
jgi:hypothetical protein